MNRKIRAYARMMLLILAVILIVPAVSGCGKSDTENTSVSTKIDEALTSEKPTIIQFSSLEHPCYKCTAMKVVLDEVQDTYRDSVNIILIDFNFNRELAAEYEVMLVPTQLFYDAAGNEVFRHSGYMHIEDIITQLTDIGVK